MHGAQQDVLGNAGEDEAPEDGLHSGKHRHDGGTGASRGPSSCKKPAAQMIKVPARL